MKGGLRSVIMRKLAFDTFNRVNKASSAAASEHESTKKQIVSLLKEYLPTGEVSFTKGFCQQKCVRLQNLTAHAEWKFAQAGMGGSQTGPRSDIVFVRDEAAPSFGEENTLRTPVALLEVGLTKRKGASASDDKWFEKFGQGTRYIDLINNDAISGQKRKLEKFEDSQESYVGSEVTEDPEPIQRFGKLRMSGPILFYVIAFSKEPNGDEEVECMKIACFVSEKRAEDRRRNTTRLALLYRTHAQGETEITTALCRMLEQISWFSARVLVQEPNEGNNWKYLGPHCARVSSVAEEGGSEDRGNRAHDSRPWPIARSSMLYHQKIDSPLFAEGARDVYDASDSESTVVQEQSGYRLFDFRGNICVIAVPFIEGSHEPKKKAQLLGVAKFLKRMHDNGLVHGDIRLLNIVFTENAEDSRLGLWW